tara:strand:- start:1248 stop:1634 length:387 start_codon:yes stop_codon:yes gene_type:complete
MNKTVETKDYGTVEVRTAVFDLDGTTLQEGIEIKGDDIELTEIAGYYDVEDITSNEVNDLLGGQVQDLIINLKTGSMKKYKNGFLPKISYWMEKWDSAAEVKDEESMKRAEEKLMYFFQRQLEISKVK